MKKSVLSMIVFIVHLFATGLAMGTESSHEGVRYGTEKVDGLNIFYCDNIARIIDLFLETRGIDRYALMIQDYGAPVGFRIAVKHPERVAGFVVMNGNAYEEGLSEEGWGPIFDYWKGRTAALEAEITAKVFSLEGMRWQYRHGTRNPDGLNPDSWNLDYLKISRPGQHRVQLDLFYDYQNNLKQYPIWQQYLRETQPPMLIV